ncbi:MAG: DUF4382 domain-containing protein [Candidatus Nanohaloarchaea archaeon]|nr:DUF4382 domain-containing protein [Candidatus Nanohaloarchaea archaeon]
MKLDRKTLALLAAVAIVLAGCVGQQQTEKEGPGNLQIVVSTENSDVEFDDFNLTFAEATIDTGRSGDNTTINKEIGEKELNMHKLAGDKASKLVDIELPSGEYDGLRLAISAAYTTIGGDKAPLLLPNGIIDAENSFEVSAGETTRYMVKIKASQIGELNRYTVVPVNQKTGILKASSNIEIME